MMEYHLAVTPSEFDACRTFLRAHDIAHHNLRFPTVVAIQEDEIVGVISTKPVDDRLVVGPIFLSPQPDRNPIYAFKNLIDAYERVLVVNNIHTYHFAVDHTDKKWLNVVEKSGVAEQEGPDPSGEFVWFKRSLLDG